MSASGHGPQAKWRVGAVSFLNTKPLVAGLNADPDVALVFDVPARLPALLDEGVVDAALVPVVDLADKGRAWQIVSDACIGCDGESLTVRVFSHQGPESIRRLYVDGDSHTSVALARVLWQELYGMRLEILPFAGAEPSEEGAAVLLIGDKVVNHKFQRYEVKTDLGSAWKSFTGLPFVFAVWAAPDRTDAAALAARLSSARDTGVKDAAAIAAEFGPGMGWPRELANRYLTRVLKFALGPPQRQGLARFLELAKEHNLVNAAPDPVFV